MEGITNLGGTCAINSLIQMICRSNKLREVILNTNLNQGTFTNELKEIIDLLYNQKKSINPMKFINNFYITFKGIFNRFEQIDISELWFYIFDKIHEETSIPINTINLNDYDNKIALYNNYKTSDILNLVQGSFINVIECLNCYHKSHSFEPFITIDVDIEDNKSIADLVMLCLKDEIRNSDEWKCENCNGNHNYLKTKKLCKLPEILLISLKRFNDINNKNNLDVYVNEQLIFNIDNNKIIYNLGSIGLHYGNLQGGHYMSICNINNESYNLYNDEFVKVINKNDLNQNYLKNNNAYLILYELNRYL